MIEQDQEISSDNMILQQRERRAFSPFMSATINIAFAFCVGAFVGAMALVLRAAIEGLPR
jgi:hypothetical protein